MNRDQAEAITQEAADALYDKLPEHSGVVVIAYVDRQLALSHNMSSDEHVLGLLRFMADRLSKELDAEKH